MAEITIRKGREADIEAVLAIFDGARRYMRATGNLVQWVGGYPAREDVLADIAAGNCYVGEDAGGEIVLVFAFILGEDPTYAVIEDGEWLNAEPYGTIHRIASNGKYRRMLDACVDYCFALTQNIRIDTHTDNRPMLTALARLGFQRCGIIYCRDGSPRLAFQKTK